MLLSSRWWGRQQTRKLEAAVTKSVQDELKAFLVLLDGMHDFLYEFHLPPEIM